VRTMLSHRNLKTALPVLAALMLFLLSPMTIAAGKAWYPVEVDVWDPPFNNDRLRTSGTYTPLQSTSKPWHICVSIPHLKDAFWESINFAVIDEAKRLGVAVRLYEAGGYGNLDVQRQQIEECMGSGADALVVGAISSDGLSDLAVQYAEANKPVVDIATQMNAEGLTARAVGDYWDIGHETGLYLKKTHPAGEEPLRVAWFPGPEGAGWSVAADTGFRAAAEEGGIEIVDTHWGDTGRATQAALVESALDANPNIDVVAGTAVTAEAAVEVLRKRGLKDQIDIMAYYYSPGVHRGISRGYILAAPSDKPAIQARIALDLVVRALEDKLQNNHVSPTVFVVDRSNIKQFDAATSLPPRGFRPIFSVGNW